MWRGEGGTLKHLLWKAGAEDVPLTPKERPGGPTCTIQKLPRLLMPPMLAQDCEPRMGRAGRLTRSWRRTDPRVGAPQYEGKIKGPHSLCLGVRGHQAPGTWACRQA